MVWRLAAVIGSIFLAASCAPRGDQPAASVPVGAPGAGGAASAKILAWSKPAAGSIVSAPVDELVLHFSPPARLDEVTVSGPVGAMPMMISAAGEIDHYALPLAGLGPGNYTVGWRASRGDVRSTGSFEFRAK